MDSEKLENEKHQLAVLDCLLEQLNNEGIRHDCYKPGTIVHIIDKYDTGDYLVQAESVPETMIISSKLLTLIPNE